MLLVILFTGICISYFRAYKVNYIFIFDIDPVNKLNQYQFYKLFLCFFTGWAICALGEILHIKGYIAFGEGANEGENKSIFGLGLVLFLVLAMLNPFKLFYRDLRFEVLQTSFNTLISPFGPVRFKDFFLADIFTSLVKPFVDWYIIACFFSTDAWKHYEPVSEGEMAQCQPPNTVVAIISLMPFWFRFWQCINRWYYTRLRFPHLVNAGKYMASLVLIIFTFFRNTYHNYEYFYIAYCCFATSYSLLWDLFMDWGLLMGKREGRKLLRDRIKYPKYFYYFSMCTNIILRFAWVLTLLPDWWFWRSFHDVQGLYLLLSVAECYRRA